MLCTYLPLYPAAAVADLLACIGSSPCSSADRAACHAPGAMNLVYYLAGQREGTDIYHADIANERFCNMKRLLNRHEGQCTVPPILLLQPGVCPRRPAHLSLACALSAQSCGEFWLIRARRCIHLPVY